MQTVIDLSVLRHNIRYIRSLTHTGFCAVVKADAYGHGDVISKYIEPLCDSFFVADSDEAMRLHLLGIKKPILVLGGEVAPFLRKVTPGIIPTACDAPQLCALLRAGYKHISIEINTGMNRLGAREVQLRKMTELCERHDVVPFTVYSHIYNGAASAAEQAQEFDRLTSHPVLRKCRHLYSSCALDLPGRDMFDMTRCGLAMYGYYGDTKPCLAARAKIAAINRVAKGEHIGYGECIAPNDMTVATVRCGYADGVRRSEKPLYLRVRGNRCAVIGVTCMDVCMIDVSMQPCRVGDYAYFISDESDAKSIADSYNTTVYEVLTGLNGRNERIYR